VSAAASCLQLVTVALDVTGNDGSPRQVDGLEKGSVCLRNGIEATVGESGMVCDPRADELLQWLLTELIEEGEGPAGVAVNHDKNGFAVFASRGVGGDAVEHGAGFGTSIELQHQEQGGPVGRLLT